MSRKHFTGIESVETDDQLAGVTFENFQFLLRRLTEDCADNCKISEKKGLFIFLIKMKTGMTFSAISILFCVHRTTVSRIFYSILQILACTIANLVF